MARPSCWCPASDRSRWGARPSCCWKLADGGVNHEWLGDVHSCTEPIPVYLSRTATCPALKYESPMQTCKHGYICILGSFSPCPWRTGPAAPHLHPWLLLLRHYHCAPRWPRLELDGLGWPRHSLLSLPHCGPDLRGAGLPLPPLLLRSTWGALRWPVAVAGVGVGVGTQAGAAAWAEYQHLRELRATAVPAGRQQIARQCPWSRRPVTRTRTRTARWMLWQLQAELEVMNPPQC